jgi:hypothetical protein
MNLFYLHRNPRRAAIAQCDKHVVKMVLETAQVLCTARHYHGYDAPYDPTHRNHPVVHWAQGRRKHYRWLWNHGMALGEEYTRRYGEKHESHRVIESFSENPVPQPFVGFRRPPATVPDELKVYQTDLPRVLLFRVYYMTHKYEIAEWSNGRQPPEWWPYCDDGELQNHIVEQDYGRGFRSAEHFRTWLVRQLHTSSASRPTAFNRIHKLPDGYR